MRIIVPFILILSFATAFSQATSTNLKIAFDFNTLETIKTNALEPIITLKANNFQVPGSFEVIKGIFSINISNVTINTMTLDWDNTHILALNDLKQPTVQIRGLNLNMSFDADLKLFEDHLPGPYNNTIVIAGLDLDLALSSDSCSADSYYLAIASYSMNQTAIDTYLSDGLTQALFTTISLFNIPIANATSFLLDQTFITLNDTLTNKTCHGGQFNLKDLITANIRLSEKPSTWSANNDTYQSFGINVEVLDPQTKLPNPDVLADDLPNYVDNYPPLQLLLSQSLLSQVLWGAYKSRMITKDLSNATMPKFSPVSLNTTDLTVIIPNIASKYGADKGVYLRVRTGDSDPSISTTDGAVTVYLPLSLEFWVDTDSSHYVNQSLSNCTTCVRAAAVDLSAFAAVVLYMINPSTYGVRIVDVELSETEVLSGNVDPEQFEATLNNLLSGLIVQINQQFSGGIPDPYVGLFGLKGTLLSVESDFLFFGISF